MVIDARSDLDADDEVTSLVLSATDLEPITVQIHVEDDEMEL